MFFNDLQMAALLTIKEKAMKVTNKGTTTKRIKDLEPGECFFLERTVYMRMKDDEFGVSRCVSLENGNCCWFGETIKVIPVEAECIWE